MEHDGERVLLELNDQLAVQRSIAQGASNFLSVFDPDPNDRKEDLRLQILQELTAADGNIAELLARIEDVQATGPASAQLQRNESKGQNGSSEQAVDEPPNPPMDSFGTTFDMILMMLQRLEELETAVEKIKSMDSIVAAVGRESRIKYELKLEDVLPSIMGCLGDEDGQDVRAATYRLLRHLVVDQHDVNQLQTHHFDMFLVRSLSRDHKFDVEKEQALRFIRLLLSLPDSDRPVPSSVIRAIVALAEQTEEKLRLASLETLGELLIRDIGLLVAADGLRVLLQSLSDGPHDLSPYIATGLLWTMDRPDSRQSLRPGVDVEIVLAGFTEIRGKGNLQEERVRTAAKIIMSFVQSWSGILYLCLNGRQAIVSLVSSLKTPSRTIRETLLDMFIIIFHVDPPAWYASSLVSKRTPMNTRVQIEVDSDTGLITNGRTNLFDQYLSFLLVVFIEAGFIEALVAVATESDDSHCSKKVSLLLGEILQLSSRVLPVSYATRVQALPSLFSLASSFDTSNARLAASSTLGTVDSMHRINSQPQPISADHQRPRSNSLDDPIKRGQRQIESSKIRLGMQIDDSTFRNLLLETQVLSTKEFPRWDFDILIQLAEGPLLAPKRLDEAMRASKFMRRILAFLHPLNYQYSAVPRSMDSVKYTKMGCTILQTLLASPDGIKYLQDDKLLRQIADCLAQLNPIGSAASPDTVFSKHRIATTLAAGYFEMIGTLTRSVEGLRLLEHFKIFTALYRISDLRDRKDVVQAVVEHSDYSIDGHTRIFLAKVLTSRDKAVRLSATNHLATLIRQSPTAQEWQIRLLLTQIYDPSPTVSQLAVHILEESCQSMDTLEIVVRMRPSLDHLGGVGEALLTRFLSTSIGVRYLHEIGFIEQELGDWFNETNYLYVVRLELLLASSLAPDHKTSVDETSFNGTPPAHFYGELVRTEEGCQILEDSGHFPEFADFIREHGLEDFDSEIIAKLKSVLWAVGHIGASPGGLAFLDQEYIVQSIVEIAEDSPVYSLRGTAFFVLGLIASTVEGVEILDELNWESVLSPLGRAMGICVPRNVTTFVDKPLWEQPPAEIPEALALAPPSTHFERETLTALANLSNHILATKASKSLAQLKVRHRQLFSSPSLYYRALEMLANYHYRLPVRRYIIELFDLPLSRQTAGEIVRAGEELKNRRDGSSLELNPTSIAAADVILDGIEADYSDDEESNPDGEVSLIPLQVLRPLILLHGFVLS